MARRLTGRPAGAALALAILLGASPGETLGQAPPFSGTLRYGSGYLEVPAAAVLPSLGLRAAGGWFRVRSDGDPVVAADGSVSDPGGERTSSHGDLSFSMGILDRVELGTTVQSWGPSGDGGRLLGAFGKLLLLDPTRSGFGVAVGARWLGRPDFGDGVERSPTRLGFPDPNARARFTDGRELDTRLTVYGVATLQLAGVRAGWIPENGVTLSLGYGTGMFREGGDLDWYAPPGWDGWFLAGGMDFALGEGLLLGVEAEHTGFDVNLGAELARGGARLGVQLLGVNHDGSAGPYRSRKVGVSLSLTACPLLRRACVPRVRTPPAADTVRLPAPPPDTVRIPPPARDTAGTAAASPSVDDLLQHPVQGVQDGDGGGPGEIVLLAGLGPQETVVASLRPGPDGGDDHPGVEGPHRLHPGELSLHHPGGDLVDGVQGGLGPHSKLALPGGHAGGLPHVLLAPPLHPGRDPGLAVGGGVEA